MVGLLNSEIIYHVLQYSESFLEQRETLIFIFLNITKSISGLIVLRCTSID